MKNLNIGTRLGLGFALLLALIVIVSSVGVTRLGSVGNATANMAQNTMTKQQAVAEWQLLLASAIPNLLAMARVADPVESAYFGDLLAEGTARINTVQEHVEQLLALPRGKELYSAIASFRSVVLEHVGEIRLLRSREQHEAANILTDQKLVPALNDYEQAMQELQGFQLELLKKDATDVEGLYRSGRTMLIGLSALAIVLGLLMAWRLTIGITRPLRHAVNVAQAVADGDLANTITVDSQDETGRLMQSLQNMNGSLAAMVREIRESSANIASGSGQIASGNADLSQRTEEQAANITETAAAMEELSSTVRSNADVARQAALMAADASKSAVQGGDAVNHVVTTMNDINTSSQKIVDIISVIDMIAFQTNILALNAAVEAARAGEQGRGFAVVASEVRSLAQKSAEAAKDIAGLINDSVQRTRAGSEMVSAAGVAMTGIVTQVQNVTNMINEISAATSEQTTGLTQISEAVVQLSDVTQQNAALVEESAAAADSLNDQARYLVGMVGRFRLDAQAAPGNVPQLTL